jgi:putative colanic acid biosynthesis UDP-glucose lipid carrier transferase
MINRRAPLRDYGKTFSAIAQMVDSVFVLAGGWIALRIVSPTLPMSLVPNRYVALTFLMVPLMLALFNVRGVYDSWRGRSPLRMARAVGLAWTGAMVITVLALAAFGHIHDFPGEWLAWWAALSFFFMICGRLVAFAGLRIARASGWNHKRVVIIGLGELSSDLVRRVKRHPWTGFEISAVFDAEAGQTEPIPGQYPVIADLDELPNYLETEGIAEVWIALPLRSEDRVREVLEILRHSTANIRYVPDFFSYTLINHAISNIAGRAMIDLSSSPMQGFSRFLKAAEDYVLSSVLLTLFSPLMLAIAAGVKLSSPGPVLYRQERVGWNGMPFMMLKFRSMRIDAENNGVEWGQARNKPVTSLGAFLRRTSLDELPQLINVLKGEMSIVGPRPERSVFVARFKDEIPKYMLKHLVKAGITGWAQINGLRGDTDLRKRIEYDIYYIENWSIWFDIRIMALTVIRGLIHKNAR